MDDDSGKRSTYRLGSWLFLRLLGLVYLIAFVSLWVQIEGLVGSEGILPVADLMDWLREQSGGDGFLRFPTLLWLADSDLALHLLCGMGVVLSALLMLGVAPIPVLVSLWVCYLSLVLGGQTFLAFQWDTLLLESGFCALFLAPLGWRPRLPRNLPPPSRAGLWLLWLLLFKLMFLSGVVKPLSMDDTWWRLAALDYHYWTQPIPTGTSWYVHHFPAGLHKLSIVITYTIEIGLPFLIFTGRLGRRAVAAGTIFLMLIISWTGNYGFFNLLTIVLCVPLLDDAVFARFSRAGAIAPRPERMARRLARSAVVVPVALIVGISFLTTVHEMVRTVPPGTEGWAGKLTTVANRWVVDWANPRVLRHIAPFRTINGYGLFRSMTTRRPEIEIEGSRDGVSWTPYRFKWKAGATERRPRFVAPHMPRLDWQMWFAALSPRSAHPWLGGLMRGLLKGTPEILALLDESPFPDAPPRYIRLVYYDYRFTTPRERSETGAWWSRESNGYLTPAITLEQLERTDR